MKSVVTKIVTHILSDYIDPITCEQLELQLWAGKASLQNVKIKDTALEVHDLPFSVKSGIIQRADFDIPWSALQSQPCIVKMDGLLLNCEIRGQVLIQSQLQLKRTILQQIEKQCKNDNTNSQSFFSGSIEAATNNLQAQLTNVHIRVEIETANGLIGTGLLINKLELKCVDENGNDTFYAGKNVVVHKQLTIEGLSIYMDTNTKPIPGDFIGVMRGSFGADHQYFIHNLNLNTVLDISSDPKSEFRVAISAICREIQAQIDEAQWVGITTLTSQVRRFRRISQFSRCGRPPDPPRSQRSSARWFIYINKCIIEERYPNRIRVGAALEMLRNRNEYKELWTLKNNQHRLEELEDQLDLDSILFLRAYSEAKKRNEETNQLTFEKGQLAELSSLNTINESRNTMKVTINTEMFRLQIGSIVTASVTGLQAEMTKLQDSIINGSIHSFDIKTNNSSTILTHRPKGDVICTFNYKFANTKDPAYLSTQLESPVLNMDFSVFEKLGSFFKARPDVSFENVVETQLAINKVVQDHIPTIVDLSLLNPQLFAEDLKFALSSITLKSVDGKPIMPSDLTSLYEHYEIGINDFTLSLRDNLLVTPISTIANMSSSIATIPSIDNLIVKVIVKAGNIAFSRSDYITTAETIQRVLKQYWNEDTIDDVVRSSTEFFNGVVAPESQRHKPISTSISLVMMSTEVDLLNEERKPENKAHVTNAWVHFKGMPEGMHADFGIEEISVSSEKHSDVLVLENHEHDPIQGTYRSGESEDYADITLQEPMIQLNFVWLDELGQFFKLRTPSKEPIVEVPIKKGIPLAPEIEEDNSQFNPLHYTVDIIKPKFILALPCKNDKTSKIEIDSESVKVTEKVGVPQIKINSGIVSINNRVASEKFDIDISFDHPNHYFKADMEYAEASIVPEDFPLIIDMIFYLRSTLSPYDPLDDIFTKVDVNIAKAKLHIVGEPTPVYAEALNVAFNKTERIDVLLQNIQAFHGEDNVQFIDGDDIFFSMLGDFSTCKIGALRKLDMPCIPIHILFKTLFFQDSVMQYEDTYPPTTSPLVVDVGLPALDAIVSTEKYLGNLNGAKGSVHVEYLPNNTLLEISVDQFEIKTNYLPESFLTCNDSVKLTYRAGKLGVDLQNAKCGFRYNVLMDFVYYISGLFSDTRGFPDDPMTMPELFYHVTANSLNLHSLHYNKEEQFIGDYMLFENLDVKSDDDNFRKLNLLSEVLTIIDGETKAFRAENVDTLFFFDLREVVPPLHEGKVQPREYEPGYWFLHNMNIDVKTGILQMWHEPDRMVEFCESVKFLFNLTSGESPWMFDFKLTAKTHKLEGNFEGINQKLIATDVEYKYTPRHIIDVSDIVIESAVQTIPYKLIQRSKEGAKTLAIHFEMGPKDIEVTLIEDRVILNRELLMPILLAMWWSPLLVFDFWDGYYPPGPVRSKTINFHDSEIGLPVDNNTDSQMLYLCGTLETRICHESMQIAASNLSANFCEKSRSKPYPPLFENLNMVYSWYLSSHGKNISLMITDIQIYISAIDVALLSLISTNMAGFASSSEKERTDQDIDSFVLDTHKICITLCEDNRSVRPPRPFLRILVNPWSLSFGLHKTIDINTVYTIGGIEYFNMELGDWDQVIEPFTFSLALKNDQQYTSCEVGSDETVKINVSYKMIKSALRFMKNIKSFKASRAGYSEMPEYIFKNMVGKPIDMEILPRKSKCRFLTPSIYPVFGLKETDELKVEVCNSSFVFSVSSLKHPIFPAKDIVVYREFEGNSTFIYISSTLVFNNLTSLKLSASLVKGRKRELISIGSSEPDAMLPIPPETDRTQPFFVFSGTPNEVPKNLLNLKNIESPKTVKTKVNDNLVPLMYSRRVDIRKGCIFIDIYPPLIIINGLPYESLFKFETGASLLIKPNAQAKGDMIYDGEKVVVFFNLSNGDRSEKTQIIMNDEAETQIVVNRKGGNQTYIVCARVQKSFEKQQATITFFAPAIFFNTTGSHLRITNGSDVEAEFVPRQGAKDPTRDGILMWGTPDFFRKENPDTRAIVKYADFKLPNPIDTGTVNVDDLIMIPLPVTNLYIPLHYNIQKSGVDFLTPVITITNHLELQNKLPFSFLLQPVSDFETQILIGEPIMIPANTSMPLLATPDKFTFLLMKEGYFQVELNFAAPIHTTFRLIGDDTSIFVNLKIQHSNNGVQIVIQPAGEIEPLMISNRLDEEIAAFQEMEAHPFLVAPNTDFPFAFDFPILNSNVNLKIRGMVIKVEMGRMNNVKQYAFGCDNIFIELQTSKCGSKYIVVSKTPMKGELAHPFMLSICLSKTWLTLVDDRDRELCLLSMHNVDFVFIRRERLNTAQVTVDQIQLDDLYPGVPIPVIAFVRPPPDKKAIAVVLTFYINAQFARAFENVKIEFFPVTAYLDMNFVNELIAFTDVFEEGAIDVKPLITEPKAADNLSFELFELYPITAIFSLRPHTDRKRYHPYVNRYINVAPSITNATIDLDGVRLSGIGVTTSFMKSTIINAMEKSVISQVRKIMGHIDLLFNVSQIGTLFTQNMQNISNGEIEKYRPAIVTGALTGTESFLRSTSGMMHSYIEGDANRQAGGLNRNAIQTIGDGFVSFGKSIALGFTGVVTKPMEESKKGGAIAGLKGFGQGLAGMVTSPFSGIMDIGAGLIGGTRKLIADDNETIPVERKQRAFINGQIRTNDPRFDAALSSLQADDLLKLSYEETFSDAFICLSRVVAITQKRLFVFDPTGGPMNNGRVIASVRLESINDTKVTVLRNGNSGVTVSVKARSPVRIECESVAQAEEICERITFAALIIAANAAL